MKLPELQARAAISVLVFCCIAASVAVSATLLLWWLIVPLLIVAELFVFPALFFLKYRRFNKQPDVHAPPPGYDPRAVFDRFTKEQHKLSKYICIKEMLQKWFWDVPIEEVKRGNVADLFTYGFWYKTRDQLQAEGNEALSEQVVSEIEEAWGVKFEEGYNKDLPFMAHLRQDLRCQYRPMVFYLGIEVLFLLKHCLMWGIGFKAYCHRGYTYYTYNMPPVQQQHNNNSTPSTQQQQQQQQQQTPILFLHGVGLGLLPYLTFVMRLAAIGQPLLAVESNHLGMRWVPHVPCEDEVVDVVVEVLEQQQVQQVALVGHSYGTFMSSRIVQRFPHKVHSLVLIDPVCFVMFSGKLIHNFVYKPHNSAITTWFVARDIHHSTSVCRNFFWSLLNLWPDQLPDKTLVVLSGQDELVPVPETIAMLEAESSAKIMYHDHHCHAEFIKDLPWQDKVVEQVARLVAAALPGKQQQGQQGQKQKQKASFVASEKLVVASAASDQGMDASPLGRRDGLGVKHDASVFLESSDDSGFMGRPDASEPAAAAAAKLGAGSTRQRAGHRHFDSATSWSMS